MTSTLTVADRRRATLERMHGTSARPTAPARRRRRAVARREDVEPLATTLGPPPGTFYAIAGVVGVLVTLGLVMVLSASAVTEANLGRSPYGVFAKQAMWAAFGLVAIVVMIKVPYRLWQRLSILVAVVAAAAMFAPFAPGIGATVNGARSWIYLGPFSLQPSEFLKVAVVILAADLLARRSNARREGTRSLIPLATLAVVAAGLSLAQGDLGSAIVLGAIVLSVAWIGGVAATPLAAMAGTALAGALLFVVSSPRRLDRFTAFLNVAEEKDHLAYQTYQGYLSMASGGLGGSGIGGSNGKLGYLPYAHSDFIFAVIADELGLIGTIAVLGGFVVLVGLGIQVALAAPDRFGMLLAGGIATWFAVQAIINVGGVTGLMPVTGLTLPFFSAGGSSLFVSMVAVGLLLSVARRLNSR